MLATSSRVLLVNRGFSKVGLRCAAAATVECLEQRMLLSVAGSDPELVANTWIGAAAGVADSLPSGFTIAPDSALIVSKDQLVSFDASTRTQKVYSLEESRAIAAELGITLPANQTSPSTGIGISADVPGLQPGGLGGVEPGDGDFHSPGFPFGTDGRTHVTTSASWPYSPVGRQYMVFGGNGFFGSGTMISRSFELTAGHCVYDYGGAGWPSSITFSAGQDGTGIDGQRSTYQPYGQANWTQAWTFTGWINSGDWNYDMGWVQLDRNLGDYTGWYAYAYNSDDNYYWNTARNTGHPGSLSWNGMQTYTQTGVPRDYGITADQLRTNTMDVAGGQSGGPLDYSQVIHGVVSSEWSSGGTPLYNMFTRMTSTKFNNIQGVVNGATAPTDRPDLVDFGAWYTGDFDWFTPSSVRPGDSFTAHSVALNIGTAATGGYTVRFRLSSDTTYDAGDYLLGDATMASLSPFAWNYVDATGTVPYIPAGQYYLVWSMDASGSVSEFDEGNNLGYDENLVTIITPANDMFANRTNLGSVTSTTDTGTNAGSGGETGEPAQSGTVNSVWWAWTAPSSGKLTVDTFGSALDTYLTLATGSAVNSLTVLAQNDDTGGLQSQISDLRVVAGTQYQIAVDGYSSNVGAITLNLSFTSNDNFANRISLGSASPLTATGTNVAFTAETGEPAQSGTINSAWWSWTAPSNGNVSVDTFGSGFDTFLTLATGSAVNSLTVLAQNDDTGGLQSRVAVPVVAGTQYQIAVDGFNSAVGAITLHVSFTATGEIRGTEWNDLDGDGVRDAGEPALANWRVYLDGNTNGQWDAGETSVLTDAGGNYAFLGLPAGTYTVAEVLQPGWTRTYPGSLLGIAWDGTLYDVNRTTGAAGNPRNTGVTTPVGITVSADGTVYVLNTYGGSPSANSLYRIDPVSGLATLVGSTGLSLTEGDLDFDPTTGVLYGIQTAQSSRMLFTINPVTGMATTVGAMEDKDMSAMAFNAAGTLYMLDTTSQRVLTIDKATGATLTAVPLSTGLGQLAGMDFDAATGELYVVDSGALYYGTNNVYRLNTTTGQMTLVGQTGLTDSSLSGLTFRGNGAHTVVLAEGAVVTGKDFGNQQNSPTGIALSASSIPENQPSGTAVGTLSTTDPDAGDTFTYTLVAGTGSTDNASFAIVGNQLRTAASFDFELKNSYSIRVRTTDATGNIFEKPFTITVTNIREATIAGRRIFYNQSYFDGNSALANAADDAAIAPDKRALLPGQTATFTNYTSYSRGINGIMVDVAGMAIGHYLSLADFTFKVGNNNTPSAWATAPAPTSLSYRDLGSGVMRYTLIWANNAIQKQWLRVGVKASDSSDLAVDDVFFFGNAIGESGDSASNALVNSVDKSGAALNPHTPSNRALITDVYDYNRDSLVNSSDQSLVTLNATTPTTALKLIAVPAGDTAARVLGIQASGSLSSALSLPVTDSTGGKELDDLLGGVQYADVLG